MTYGVAPPCFQKVLRSPPAYWAPPRRTDWYGTIPRRWSVLIWSLSPQDTEYPAAVERKTNYTGRSALRAAFLKLAFELQALPYLGPRQFLRASNRLLPL